MKNLLIIGASGFGRGTYDMCHNSIGFGTDFVIKGFLDLNLRALDEHSFYPNVISSEDDYEIMPDDVFICAFGDVNLKKKVTEKMLKRGAKFYTLIHKTASISPSSKIGEGTIIQSYVGVDAGVKIGEHCLIQSQTILGHDVEVGDYTRIDCRVMCVGGVMIGNNVNLHTGCVINHKVIVDDNATVGACSFVIRKVHKNTHVFGVPAKKIEF